MHIYWPSFSSGFGPQLVGVVVGLSSNGGKEEGSKVASVGETESMEPTTFSGGPSQGYHAAEVQAHAG